MSAFASSRHEPIRQHDVTGPCAAILTKRARRGERKRSIHTEAMAVLYHATGASRILDDRPRCGRFAELERGLVEAAEADGDCNAMRRPESRRQLSGEKYYFCWALLALAVLEWSFAF